LAYIKDEIEMPNQLPTTKSFSHHCKLTRRCNKSNENFHLKLLAKIAKVLTMNYISPYYLPNPSWRPLKERYPNNNALVQTFSQPNLNELLADFATWIS
jgi:hypothetical protein